MPLPQGTAFFADFSMTCPVAEVSAVVWQGASSATVGVLLCHRILLLSEFAGAG